MRTEQKGATCKPRRRGSEGTRTAYTLSMNLQPPDLGAEFCCGARGLWHLVWTAGADQDATQSSSQPCSGLKVAGFLPLPLAINFCRSDPVLGLLLTQPAEAPPTSGGGRGARQRLAGSARFWISRSGRWALDAPLQIGDEARSLLWG